MAKCPSCGSKRLRNGYRRTFFAWRAVGVRMLLCESCNNEFLGFSPLPPKKPSGRHQRKADVFHKTQEFDLQAVGRAGVHTRQRLDSVNFDRTALPLPIASIATAPMPVYPTPETLRQSISAIPAQVQTEEPLMQLREELEARRQGWSGHPCPQCDSPMTRRRHRKAWEKLLLAWSEKRPYSCGECGANFYARRTVKQQRKVTNTDQEFVKSSCFNQERER
jgi:transposase-like protein